WNRIGQRLRRITERPASIELTRYEKLLPAIGERENEFELLSDTALTAEASRLLDEQDAEKQLVKLCALGREAARRVLNERAFDVQLLGTMALLSGHVVEMATGEGKTLSGAIAAAG